MAGSFSLDHLQAQRCCCRFYKSFEAVSFSLWIFFCQLVRKNVMLDNIHPMGREMRSQEVSQAAVAPCGEAKLLNTLDLTEYVPNYGFAGYCVRYARVLDVRRLAKVLLDGGIKKRPVVVVCILIHITARESAVGRQCGSGVGVR